ncbi:hypothetical protein ABT173_39945 [Streptomyces sp. NPDC001795]|uniref:hypothetical protein n=1 Tax=unclassified Streptomyces TaxID=2593676 RepID=UPI00332E2F55
MSVPAAEVERDADHLLRQAAAGPRTGAQRVQERGAGGDIGALRLIALVLPASQRADWLEEQRGYIADLPRRRKRWGWIIAQTVAMPKYAYAVRTGREAEAA